MVSLLVSASMLAVLDGGALAGIQRGPPAVIGLVPPPVEAAGCYYYKGRQYCGRYCYTEVNGKRYCQRFERDAYPQGELEEHVPGLK